ncbi:MAG: hypothetical protein WDN75_05145 [Bacteroidota bacterium]
MRDWKAYIIWKGNDHVVEKNVVVLVREQKAIPEGADAKTVKKITRQNARIGRENAAVVAGVANELNQHFGGAQNKKGENVNFKFNVTGLAVKNTNGGTNDQLRQLSIANGVKGAPKFPGGPDQIAPATIVTTQSAATGENNQFYTKVGSTSPEGTLSHELGTHL